MVETVNFNGKHDQIGRPLLSSGENLSLVERFTLMDDENLMYEYTVRESQHLDALVDRPAPDEAEPGPDVRVRPVTRGNYGKHGIMAGSRVQEAAAAAAR